jgi:hypothetical protein
MCQDKLEARAAAAATRQRVKIKARETEERTTGTRKRGRKPKAPDPGVDPEAAANPTDPGQRHHAIMKTRRGWVQGYNAQAVVTPGQIVLSADVTTEADDVRQLTGMLDQAQANVEAVVGEDAVLGAAVADAGCWSPRPETSPSSRPARPNRLPNALIRQWATGSWQGKRPLERIQWATGRLPAPERHGSARPESPPMLT